MKFLSRTLDNMDLMPINTYYIKGTEDYSTPDDVLYFVYKEMDTGRKYVEEIVNPKIEMYLVKPEYRDFDYYKNWINKDKCDVYTVPYKSRYKEIGKILGCSPKEAQYSKYLFQGDLNIETFYLLQFYLEYNTDKPKTLSLGFSDIESDIINFEKFADPGEAPPNAISYFDNSTNNMYTLVCVQDNVPHVNEKNPKYEHYEKLRTRFKHQTDEFINDIDGFIKECNDTFDEIHGHIDYHVLVFEDELSMAKAYWQIVDKCDNDFLYFWNAPYDVSNLIERPRALGVDPNTFISSKDFRRSEIKWHEDKNAQVHKRKHIFDTFTRVNIQDQMVNYAGIRSGGSKLPSVKLNAIAQNELKDSKLDYSEYGNIKMFPYYNFRQFIKYNIKDVLLQAAIERKVRDADYIYTLMYLNALKSSEVFTSTSVVLNSLRVFGITEKNTILGPNKNKLFRVKKTPEQIKEEKKNKFAGAFVMNPAHASPTGFKLLGLLNRYLHIHVIDMDITSEYPTGMYVTNCCNETMVGKVFLDNDEDIELKMYENMYFIDKDDEDGYRKTANKSNLMMEGLTENNPTEFGRQYLKLPTFTEISEHIEDCIDDFI